MDCPRFTLNRLRVLRHGHVAYDQEFHEGVNIIRGENGSGKSTSIRMLLGLLRPTSGSASVLGCSMPRDAEKLRSRVGYMTQKFSLYDDLSVVENLEFTAEIFGLETSRRRRRLAEVLDEHGLDATTEQFGAAFRDVGYALWHTNLAARRALRERPDLDYDDEEEFTFVSAGDEDYNANKYLITSPIGQGLLGKKVGEKVKRGDIVEAGDADEIFDRPQTDYTRELMSAAFG